MTNLTDGAGERIDDRRIFVAGFPAGGKIRPRFGVRAGRPFYH